MKQRLIEIFGIGCIGLLAMFLAPGAVFAHAGAFPQTVDVQLQPGNQEALFLEVSYGLLRSETAERFSWICHEGVTQPDSIALPRFRVTRGGVYLAFLPTASQGIDPQESMYRSVDGCAWEAVAGLRDRQVTAVVVDPEDENRVLAATATLGDEQENGIFLSVDGGASWSPTSMLRQERLFLSLVRSRESPEVLLATANWMSPMAVFSYWSTDGGATWTEQQLFFELGGNPQVLVDALAVSSDGQRGWFRVNAPVTEHLLETSDQGESLTELFTTSEVLLDLIAEEDGSLWLAESEAGLLRRKGAGDLEEVVGSPSVMGLAMDARGLHLAANELFEDFSWGLTQDGLTIEPRLGPSSVVGPLSCPKGTVGRDTCYGLWPLVEGQLGLGDDDDSSVGDDDDSGDDGDTSVRDPDQSVGVDGAGAAGGCCAAGAGEGADASAVGLSALLVAWLPWRRRQRCRVEAQAFKLGRSDR